MQTLNEQTMQNNDRPRRGEGGFTLIEMAIVVAIIGILSAFAVPSYMKYVGRTYRTAAQACLAQYANYMERYYTTNLRYDKAAAGGAAYADPQLDCQAQVASNYVVTQATTASSFTITATPTTVQQSRDKVCGTLTLNQNGARTPTADGCW